MAPAIDYYDVSNTVVCIHNGRRDYYVVLLTKFCVPAKLMRNVASYKFSYITSNKNFPRPPVVSIWSTHPSLLSFLFVKGIDCGLRQRYPSHSMLRSWNVPAVPKAAGTLWSTMTASAGSQNKNQTAMESILRHCPLKPVGHQKCVATGRRYCRSCVLLPIVVSLYVFTPAHIPDNC